MEVGLIVMRGQPVHCGHIRLIDYALSRFWHEGDIKLDTLIIVLGSVQEVGTERNPFTFSERKRMIRNCYGDEVWKKIKVIGLKDIFSLHWSDYVLETINNELFYSVDPGKPNVQHIFGSSQYDVEWFRGKLTPHTLDRTASNFVSASMVREMLTIGDPTWKKHVPLVNWKMVAKKFNRLDQIEDHEWEHIGDIKDDLEGS